MSNEKNNTEEQELNYEQQTKQEKLFLTKLKRDNKALAIRVENLELQIKFYNYSEQLNNILVAMGGTDEDVPDEEPQSAENEAKVES
jgi:hypothetical protein